jgi:DNA-binding Xre family transcriptional regulator
MEPTDPTTSEQLLRVFGRNIEVYALRRKMLLKDLAEKIQVTPAALSRARNKSSRYIDPEILVGCSRVFECTVDELLKPIDGVFY